MSSGAGADASMLEAEEADVALAAEVLAQAMEAARPSDSAPLDEIDDAIAAPDLDDVETTINLTGDMLPFPGRDDLDPPTVALRAEALVDVDRALLKKEHLRGLIEALVFASDEPIKSKDLAKLASAPLKEVAAILDELGQDYAKRGIRLEEVAGGWVFRTSAQYAPFVRDLTKQKPVRLSRAQVETLAIIAYRQPVTRPEIDDVRGVDSGPVLKLLLERDLVRILGKRDEPGRPLIYGTTTAFLEFFGLKSLKDLPTLREFTELTDESREKYEEELGEPPNEAARQAADDAPRAGEAALDRDRAEEPSGEPHATTSDEEHGERAASAEEERDAAPPPASGVTEGEDAIGRMLDDASEDAGTAPTEDEGDDDDEDLDDDDDEDLDDDDEDLDDDDDDDLDDDDEEDLDDDDDDDEDLDDDDDNEDPDDDEDDDDEDPDDDEE